MKPQFPAAGNVTDVDVDMKLMWEEIDGIMDKHKIKSYTFVQSRKKYAFEVPDIPFEADWFEASYSYACKQYKQHVIC